MLPVVALGMLGIGNIALHTRSKVAEVMNSEFIHYAKAQGDKGWPMAFIVNMRLHPQYVYSLPQWRIAQWRIASRKGVCLPRLRTSNH